MDPVRFDQISRLFAHYRLSRRTALRAGSAGLAAGLVGGATVAAAPVTVGVTTGPIRVYRSAETGALAAAPPAPSEATKPTTFMFVQSFVGGSLVPQPGTVGKQGRYTLTLPHGLGQTIYFSDRPERLVGVVPTPQFLKGMPFPEANPPNAVLVARESPTHEDLVVLELFNPRYDTSTNTATYDAQILKDTRQVDLVFTETPDEAVGIPRTYSAAHLFIDDCPNGSYYCAQKGSNCSSTNAIGPYSVGCCWSWSSFSCNPCGDLNAMCNNNAPSVCNGNCEACAERSC